MWVHAQAEVSRDENGIPVRLLGTIVDITEQKRVEQTLRESERKYRELVEHANSIILRWSHDGQITFLNEFGQKFSATPTGRFSAATWWARSFRKPRAPAGTCAR